MWIYMLMFALGVWFGLGLALMVWAERRYKGGVVDDLPDDWMPPVDIEKERVLADVEFDMYTELDDLLRDVPKGLDTRK